MVNKHLPPDLLRQPDLLDLNESTPSVAVSKTIHSQLFCQNKEQQNHPLIKIGDGLWDWNLQTNTIYFSPSWKAMLGYQDSEIGDSPIEWLHRIHPDDVEKVRAELTAHLAERTPQFKNEHRILHRDGNYRWIRSQGRVVRDSQGELYQMVGFQTDITAYKEAIAALHHSEAQFRTVAEALPFLLARHHCQCATGTYPLRESELCQNTVQFSFSVVC
jgi:PAS domain S-box-containing protein